MECDANTVASAGKQKRQKETTGGDMDQAAPADKAYCVNDGLSGHSREGYPFPSGMDENHISRVRQ
jgi:hypothetical protein